MKKYLISIFIFIVILTINLSVNATDWDEGNEAQIMEASKVVHEKISERKEGFTIIIDYVCPENQQFEVSQVGTWILDRACSDDYYENGDYFESCLTPESSVTWGIMGTTVVDNTRKGFVLSLKYNLKYYSTKEQENILDTNIQTWINSNIDIENDTDLEKIKKIYKYITTNVDYDYTYQKYSAYNAFVEGQAVCNGYSMLLYKMSKMAGIDDVRIVTGEAFNGEKTERHAWNLIKIEDKYYYLDATWDATLHGEINDKVENMTYFLTGSDSFDKNHFPEKEINSEFNISTEPYFKKEIVNNGIYLNSTSKLKEKDINNVSIISGISLNTNILDFINQNNFNYEYSIKLSDKNNQDVSINSMVATGTNVRLLKNNQIEKEYKVVIYGDTTGDGKITAVDALAVIKHINNKILLPSEAHIEAGRVRPTSGVNLSAVDALAIIKTVNGKNIINQNK